MRAGDRAEDVVRRLHVGHPVAERLVDRVLERARAGGHRNDLGAEQAHPRDVERLAAGVLLAHVDRAGQPHQRSGGRRRDAVLAGAGLGDDPLLADALGQERLAEHIVDLVRARVVEVLALEQDPGAAAVLGEPLHLGDRARPAGVVALQPVELGEEGRVHPHGLVGLGQLVEGGDQRLGHEPPAVHAEVPARVGPARSRRQETFSGLRWAGRRHAFSVPRWASCLAQGVRRRGGGAG
jgi:hypothetical protein